MELKDILQKKINNLGIKKQVAASQVCDAYNKYVEEIFGEEISKDTEAVSYKNGILKVRVSNSALSQEIQGRSKEILEKINGGNENEVKRIIFN